MNNADEQIAPVKILDGQYKGMLYSYGMVQIVPKFESFANVMDDDELTLKLEYNVMKESPVEDDNSPAFDFGTSKEKNWKIFSEIFLWISSSTVILLEEG